MTRPKLTRCPGCRRLDFEDHDRECPELAKRAAALAADAVALADDLVSTVIADLQPAAPPSAGSCDAGPLCLWPDCRCDD